MTRSYERDLGVEECRRVFPRIHFDLDWATFARQNWPVERVVFRRRDELMTLGTALRIRLGRVAPRFLKTIGSHYVPVSEALEQLSKMDRLRQDTIADYLNEYREAFPRFRMQFATSRLSETRNLILDGSHRACALAASERPFILTLTASTDHGVSFRSEAKG